MSMGEMAELDVDLSISFDEPEASEPTMWFDHNGKASLIAEMSTDRLRNIVRWAAREGKSSRRIDAIQDELESRGILHLDGDLAPDPQPERSTEGQP